MDSPFNPQDQPVSPFDSKDTPVNPFSDKDSPVIKGNVKTPEGVPVPDAKQDTSFADKPDASPQTQGAEAAVDTFGNPAELAPDTEKFIDDNTGAISPVIKGAAVVGNTALSGINAAFSGASTTLNKTAEQIQGDGSSTIRNVLAAPFGIAGETVEGIGQGALLGTGLMGEGGVSENTKSFEQVAQEAKQTTQPIFDSVFQETQDKSHQADLFRSQQEALGNIALSARNPFTLTSDQIKNTAETANTDGKLNDTQFQTNISEPVQEAIDNGVPKAVIQKELEQNLALNIRDPDYRQELVNKALEPYRDTATVEDKVIPDEAKPDPETESLYKSVFADETTKTNDTSPTAGKNLLTPEDIDKTIKPSFEAANVNNMTYFDRLSRVFSKKNDKMYGDYDNNFGDTTLTKAKLAREQNRNVITSMIGDKDGTQRYIYQYKNGIQTKNPDVLPLTTIYNDAKKGGVPLEDLQELTKSANALDDYNNLKGKAKAISDNIADLTTQLSSADTVLKRNALRNELKGAKDELKAVSEKNSYMPESEAQATYDKLTATPAGKNFLDERQKWFSHLLDISKESGLLSDADVSNIQTAHPNYLPSMREVEAYGEDLTASPDVKGTSKGYTTRDISDKEYNTDPITNEMTKGMSVIRRAQDNVERQHMVDWLTQHLDDDAFAKVFRESKSDVMTAIEKAKDGTASNVTKADSISSNPNPNLAEKPGNLSIFYNGKRVDLTLRDSNLRNSIANPNSFAKSHAPEFVQKGYKAWVATSQVARNVLTTWNPMFSIGAMMKSTMDYPFISSSEVSGLGRYNPLRSVKAVYELAKDHELNDYIKANISPGVLNRDLKQGASKDLLTKARNSLEDKSTLSKAVAPVAHAGKMVVHSLEEFAELSENMNRYRYYKEAKADALKQGYDAEDAERIGINAGKNLEVNYFQKGYGTAFNKWTAVTPFLRTQINSTTKNLLALKHRPQQIGGTLATMAGALYAVDAYNKQYTDKDGKPLIDKLDPQIRKDNVIIYLPGAKDVNDYVKIPAGFSPFTKESNIASIGVSKVMTAIANKLYQNATPETQAYIKAHPELASYMKVNNLTANDLTTMGMDALVGQFNISSALPVGVSQGVNLAMNKDVFGKDIVPSFLQDLPASQQVMPGRTSQIMSALSDYAAKTGRPALVNPIIADYLITGFFGGMGQSALDGADLIYAHATGKEIPQKEGQSIIPGASRFTGMGTNIQAEGITSMYGNLYKEFKGAQDSVDALKKNVDVNPANADAWIQSQKDNSKALELYNNYFKPTQKYVGEVYQEINRLQAGDRVYNGESTNNHELMGDPERRAKIDELRQKIIEAQRSVIQQVDEHKEELGNAWTDRLNVLPQTKTIKGFFRAIGGNMISDAHADIDNPPAQTQPAQEQSSYKDFFSNMATGVGSMYKDNVIDNTMHIEGGFSNNPNDRGGATNMGITLKTLQEFRPNATVQDLKNLTPNEVKGMYDQKYWTGANVDKLPADIQDIVFDMNVNHGVNGSAKVLQKALNSLGANVKVDGGVGQQTIDAAQQYDSTSLRRAILLQNRNLYNSIVKSDPTQAGFLKGWMKRVDAESIPVPHNT